MMPLLAAAGNSCCCCCCCCCLGPNIFKNLAGEAEPPCEFEREGVHGVNRPMGFTCTSETAQQRQASNTKERVEPAKAGGSTEVMGTTHRCNLLGTHTSAMLPGRSAMPPASGSWQSRMNAARRSLSIHGTRPRMLSAERIHQE